MVTMSSIRVLALDVDGVVTDGTASISASGNEDKRLCFQDLDAITQARRLGLRVVLITAEDTPAVDAIAQRIKCDLLKRGAKDKLAALKDIGVELALPLDQFCYVGDADRDAQALTAVGLGLAPDNATPKAKASAHRVLTAGGGRGAVAECVRLLQQLHEDARGAEDGLRAMAAIVRDSLDAHRQLLDESLPVLVSIMQAIVRAIRAGRKILIFGNGGSAADAQHVAGELVGRFACESEPWPVIALTTDTSILTAVGNDWDFADIFARQVRALARPGDLVVGISTSGRSPNVIRGLQAATAQGAATVGFTGMDGGVIPKHAAVCFRAPARTTPRIQELHLLAWHAICELAERELMRTDMAAPSALASSR